ncbi:MAG: hypothetical protein ACRCWG_15365 [Sarcina sp.]
MGLKSIAKMLILPMIASISLIGNVVEVEAAESKEKVVQNFYEGIINKDIESIIEYSEDTRYLSEEERYISLEILTNNPNESIVEYEILDDGNANDDNFLVREHYLNGEIVENNIKVDGKKVVLSISEQQTAKRVKEGEQIPMTIEQQEKIDNLIEKRNRADMGYWNQTLSKDGSTMTRLVSFSNKSGATVEYRQNSSSSSTRVKYHLYNIRVTQYETLLMSTPSGNNTSAKQLYTSLNKSTTYSNTRVEVINKTDRSVTTSGNLYIS